MNRYLSLASPTLLALSFPSKHKTTSFRLPLQQLQGFSTMVHMVTELLLMTQLKTQLTKSVLSLPFIQKSKSIHLLHLCGRLRLITHNLKHLWSLARVYTLGTSLSMPILLLWLELQLFPPHLNFTLISTYPCEFSSQSPDFSDPTLKICWINRVPG